MKKVLIITHWFPPMNMIASKRFGIMCKYFEKYGYRPYVLTAAAHKIPGSGFLTDMQCPIDEKQITRIGQMGMGYIPQSLLFNVLNGALEFFGIFLNTLAPSAVGRYEKIKKEIDISCFHDVDIIIGTYPEIDSIYLANYLSKKIGCPYLADIRDLVDFSDGIPKKYKHDVKLDVFIEKFVLKNASAIIPVTLGYKSMLRKRYPHKRIKVVYNGWEKTAEKNEDESSSAMPECKYLYYAGVIYEHRLESIMLLAECVKKANDKEHIEFIIRSTGPIENDKKMKAMIKKKGWEEIIKVLEPEKEEKVRNEQRSAYINVVLSTIHADDEELMATIPGKVFELLPFKNPILAVVPEGSDVSKLLKTTNKGIGSTDSEKIIDFILSSEGEFEGNEKVQTFSREKQAEKYCRIMDSILGDRQRCAYD